MKLDFVRYTPEHEPAAAAFNERMKAGHAPTAFLLPEHIDPPYERDGVTAAHYLAIDGTGAVRGGFIGWHHPAVVGGAVEQVLNVQSPISEGIVDPAYLLAGSQLMKFALRQTPYVYVVGMGAEENPLPRLLKAMGWKIRAVPFYFRLLRAARCVRQLGPLRNSAVKRLAGNAAAMTGLASLGASLLQRRRPEAASAAAGFRCEPVTEWGDWAEDVWSAHAPTISFGVLRNREVLPFFYPLDGGPLRVWSLERGGRREGWFSLVNTRMQSNAYFGNLQVATLADCVGSEAAVRAGCVLAADMAREMGADLLITNQQHHLQQKACLQAGWRGGPSNFLVAASRALTERVEETSMYVTRRDGDGLTNLMARPS